MDTKKVSPKTTVMTGVITIGGHKLRLLSLLCHREPAAAVTSEPSVTAAFVFTGSISLWGLPAVCEKYSELYKNILCVFSSTIDFEWAEM